MPNNTDPKDIQNKTIITRDWLAIERTKLANERTILDYFRTFLVILGTGVTILKLSFFSDLKSYGIVLIISATILLIIGVLRFLKVKKTIGMHYKID